MNNDNNFVDVIESVDEVEDSTVILEQRIGLLEKKNSLLRTRLNLLENALNVLENSTDNRFTDVETSVQGHYIIITNTLLFR